MENHTTPDPHHLPGYGGHCSQFKYYIGGTYGRLTNRALLNPYISHSKDVNLEITHRPGETEAPTFQERSALHNRQNYIDAVYRDPIVPGYRGFVPKIKDQIGKRFHVAATSALAEYEGLMELKRCELRNLRHDDILQNSIGIFESHMGERMMPKTKYRAPLIPIKKKCQGIRIFDECDNITKKIPYSKDEVPHFKENDDEDKWIIKGYCGHIPYIRFLFGQSNKSLTHAALNEFSNNKRHRKLEELCGFDQEQTDKPECMIPDCDIYRSQTSVIPHYGGHIPGRIFQFGKRYALESTDVKNWMHRQKVEAVQNLPPRCGEQCR